MPTPRVERIIPRGDEPIRREYFPQRPTPVQPPPPPPQPPKRKGQRIKARSDAYREEPHPIVNPPSYLEVLKRGLKEARAKQYADKVAQYDKFFQW